MDSDEHVDSSDISSTSSTVSSVYSNTSDVDLSSNYYNSNNNNNNNYSIITSGSSGENLKVSPEESGDGAGVTRRLKKCDILSTSSTVSSIFSTSDVDLSSNYSNSYSITSSSSGEILAPAPLKVSPEESGDGAGVTRRLKSDISSASSTVSSIFSTSDVEYSYSITSGSSGEILAPPLKVSPEESGDGAGVTTRQLNDILSTGSTVSSIFSTSDVDLSSNYSNSYSITSSSSGEVLEPLKPEESGDGAGVTTRRLNSDISSVSSTVSSIFSTSDVELSSNYNNSYSITSSSSGDNLAAAAVAQLKLSPEELGDVAGLATRRLKKKCVGKNKGVVWGFKSVIGRRKEMEDAVAVVPGFMTRSCEHVGGCTGASGGSGEISPVHFFGVYDGHGGSQVAKFCSERMHEVIAEEWDQDANDDSKWQQRWEAVMSSSFERADNEVTTEAVAPDIVGSTAVTVVLSGCQIIVSNCGDSRAVLCRGTETIPLTIDQKPDREDELLRIEAQDGKVINWNGARVFGVLAMSRAIGDRHFRPWVIPVPEISFTTRTEDDECLIIASDGLWDVMSNTEVGEVAQRIIRRRRRYAAAGESTAAQTLADSLTEIAVGRNSSDNISVIVVDLKSKKSKQNT